MKFPRNARILRSQLDAAPFAAVFFLLVIFMMLGSLIYTPGARVELQLPQADGLAGTDKPTVSVAIDADGRLYYENQWIEEKALRGRLQEVASKSSEPLTLVVQADKSRQLRTVDAPHAAGARRGHSRKPCWRRCLAPWLIPRHDLRVGSNRGPGRSAAGGGWSC